MAQRVLKVGPTINPYAERETPEDRRRRLAEATQQAQTRSGQEFAAQSQMYQGRLAREQAERASREAALNREAQDKMDYRRQYGREMPSAQEPARQDPAASMAASRLRNIDWAERQQREIAAKRAAGWKPSINYNGMTDDDSDGQIQATAGMMRAGEMSAQRSRMEDMRQSVGSRIRGYDKMVEALRTPVESMRARDGQSVPTDPRQSIRGVQLDAMSGMNRDPAVAPYQQIIARRAAESGGLDQLDRDQGELARLEQATAANELLTGNVPIGQQALEGRMNPVQLAQYRQGQQQGQPRQPNQTMIPLVTPRPGMVDPNSGPMIGGAIPMGDGMTDSDVAYQNRADRFNQWEQMNNTLGTPVGQPVQQVSLPLQAPIPQMDRLTGPVAYPMPEPQPEQAPASPALPMGWLTDYAQRLAAAGAAQRMPQAPMPSQPDQPAMPRPAMPQRDFAAERAAAQAAMPKPVADATMPAPGTPAALRAAQEYATMEAARRMPGQPGQEPTATQAALAPSLAKTITPFEDMGIWDRGWSILEKGKMGAPNDERAKRWNATGQSLKAALQQMTNDQQLALLASELQGMDWFKTLKPEAQQIIRQTIEAKRQELTRR